RAALITDADQDFILPAVAVAFLNGFDRYAQYLQLVVAERLIQLVAPGHEFFMALTTGVIGLIGNNAAAAFFFGQLAGGLGLFDQFSSAGAVGAGGGQADAEVDAEGAGRTVDMGGFNLAFQDFGTGFRSEERRVGKGCRSRWALDSGTRSVS